MKLTGLHLLLTYQCTFECDHCFVWGSPWQSGVMTLVGIHNILQQAVDTGTISSIYFEGGEPFLYYSILREGIQEAASLGFDVGIVTNAYWANSLEDALANLRPFVDRVQDLSVSSDLFHWDEMISRQSQYANQAAKQLNIPTGMISIAQPETVDANSASGQLPLGESGIMFRGRAADTLAGRVPHHPWDQFTTCPYEDLRNPGRLHLDPFGHLHICQGITLGNLFLTPLNDLCAHYDPETHPITGPLLTGGPAELVRRYALPLRDRFADACHLCYQARLLLRERFPEILTPDQMYGVS